MTSRRKLKNIFYINLFLLILFCNSYPQIAFNRFVNRSIYDGKWNLEYDVPDFIADYTREKLDVRTYSPTLLNKILTDDSLFQDKYDLYKKLLIQYTVDGRIKKFTINRFTAGEPKFGGYETYSVEINIEFILTDIISNKILFQEHIENNISDVGLGLTIFGRESQAKREFYKLNNINFGSPEFMETYVAKTLLFISEQFTKKIQPILKSVYPTTPPKTDTLILNIDKMQNKTPFEKKLIKGSIISIDNETKEVFINLGSADLITKGDIINVYAVKDSVFDQKTNAFLGVTEKKVGEIEIIEVRGERFSLGLITKETEKIEKNMEIRKIIILPK